MSTKQHGALAEPAALKSLSRFLTALGDPTRQQIVLTLSRERLTVGELSERFSLSRPAISHHLKVLADALCLQAERSGRERVYRVDANCCRQFVAQLQDFVRHCCAGGQCCT